MDRIRARYIVPAKARALKHLDFGDLVLALASMGNDMRKTPPLFFPPRYVADQVGAALQFVLDKDAASLRQWIVDFA